jgi:elongation factor P
MLKATEIKPLQAVLLDGQLHVVLSTEFTKPGKGPAYVQLKTKNVDTGTIKINRINSSDKVEDVEIERQTMQFLYDGGGRGDGPFVFMDTTSYEQTEIGADVLPREQSQWLKAEIEVMVTSFGGRILAVALPPTVELKIVETTPQVKGSTATNQAKEATLETGAVVRVPPFIESGQVVRVKTDNGEYLGKA